MATYRIQTWDIDLQKFTPHHGVPSSGLSLYQLRLSMRMLQDCGYDCHYSQCGYGDPQVLVERE